MPKGARPSRAPARPRAATTERIGSQTVADLVSEIAARLSRFESARQEATELVAALFDVPRHWPLLRSNKWVPNDVWSRALRAADVRAAGAPLAYAVGRANFRQLTLDVDERVLIPRPETELLVDLVLERVAGASGGTVIDVGTGSGAIAIALSTEGQFSRVIATDISADALDVARGNAAKYSRVIEFVPGTLPPPAPRAGRVGARVIVSNPPYIAFDEIAQLPASVRDWEPMIALVSGRGGLAVTARLVRDAATQLETDGLLALEVDARRAALVAEMVSSDTRYENVSVHLDLSGRERFVLATKRARGGGSKR